MRSEAICNALRHVVGAAALLSTAQLGLHGVAGACALLHQSSVVPLRPAPLCILHASPLALGGPGISLDLTSSSCLYSATCPSGYFLSGTGSFGLSDWGRVPSPSGPANSSSARPGCSTSYTITGFEIAYCTDSPSVQCTVRFVHDSAECVDPNLGSLAASFDLTGLPGSPDGSLTCWIVPITLGAQAFLLNADADGQHDGGPTSNGETFAWTLEFPAGSGTTGPMLTVEGGQSPCQGFGGTIWDPVYDVQEAGSGMQNSEVIARTQSGGPSECIQVHGAGAMHLRLFAANPCPMASGSAFCSGNGTGTGCPCVGSPPGFPDGCRSSVGYGLLNATGTSSIGSDTLVLRAAGLPPAASALFFQGTERVLAGAGLVFGDGLRCAGGTVLRLGTKSASLAGTAAYPGPGDSRAGTQGNVTIPGTRTYQVWYRNSASYCTPAAFNLTNGWELDWLP